MEYIIESTKTNAGTRKIPMTDEVFKCFQAILEDRGTPTLEKMVGGRTGFLFLDDNGMPLVAMHWEHRFNHMVNRYNEIYREQISCRGPRQWNTSSSQQRRTRAPGRYQ